jgi:hypothetical protein
MLLPVRTAKLFLLLPEFGQYSYSGVVVLPPGVCVMAPAHPVKILKPSPQPRRFSCAYSN